AGDLVVTVARGDTVGALAARHGSTVAAVVAANGLDAGARIVEGRQLRIPAAGASAADAAPAARTGAYTVRSGDTLGSIAAATGTTVRALREANGLDARGFIRDGQVLTLGGAPAPAQEAEEAPAPTGGYTVRRGDTLSGIAAAQGTTVAALRAANDLGADGFLREGQRLSLGAGAAAAPSAPPVKAGSVVEAAAANRARLADADLPSKARMQEIVRSTAVRLGVDPSLALAIAFQESGFRMRVVSDANAIGAMQVLPGSGEWAEDLLGEDIDLFDPEDNAKAGVAILRTLVANNAPDVAIASYYQGNASVRARGMYDDTRRYVANVQTLQARFR
ncbi:lytic transglycosylase, partial [Kineococcus rubinsiae]|uniref:lytic transglycosylase n=1 Tax=Kineococcus rubinsiae TaxID=2609562 RepID=UPI00143016C4